MKLSKTGLVAALFCIALTGILIAWALWPSNYLMILPPTLLLMCAVVWAIASFFRQRKQAQVQDASPIVVVEQVTPAPVPAPKVKAKAKAKVKAPPVTTPAQPVAPACPHCKKTMVLKVARSGANAGGNFWGCADHPKCRGMRAIFAPLPSKRR